MPRLALFAFVTAVVACSGSVIDDYFNAADLVLDEHSVTMTGAESSMFEISTSSAGAGLSFGSDAVTADRLLPIFRDTGAAIQGHLARWDEIDPPDEAIHYHSLVRTAMGLRLQAMQVGAEVLGEIAGGTTVDDPFTSPENAMADANAVLRRALEEAELVRN